MLVLVAMVLGAADGGVGVSLSPIEVYTRVSSSVFLVTTDTGLGSAVIIGPELLVTNAHVIKAAKTIRVSRDDIGWDATVEKMNVEHDVALLRVPGLRRPVPRRRTFSTLKVGERVYALGAPQGLEQTFSEGIVSALRPGTKELRPLQHTAPIAHGSSGGGLFDDRGRLVGLNTMMRAVVKKGRTDLAGDLNFAVPTDWIDELLAAKSGGSSALVGDAGFANPRPAFTVLRRPPAVDCHLMRRQRYAPGLTGEFTERIGEEVLDDHLYVLGFGEEVAEVREKTPFAAEQSEVVMSAVDIASGIVQFAGSRFAGLTFVFGEDGAIVVLFGETASLRGQPRRLLTLGECALLDTAAMKEQRESAIRRQDAEFEGQASAPDPAAACENGAPGACLVHGNSLLKLGAERTAAGFFGKACLLGSLRGCDVAFEMYREARNAKVAAEMQQRLCRLGGCVPGMHPAPR